MARVLIIFFNILGRTMNSVSSEIIAIEPGYPQINKVVEDDLLFYKMIDEDTNMWLTNLHSIWIVCEFLVRLRYCRI